MKIAGQKQSTAVLRLRCSGLPGDPAREIDVKEYANAEAMISKCANPNCSKLLMRMDGGRFFGFPTASKRIEHFWLCHSCSKHFTLRLIEGQVELQRRDRKIA